MIYWRHMVSTNKVIIGSGAKQDTSQDQGWGLLNQFPPLRYFPNFSALSKHPFVLEYHVYIWQVSPQLSCGDSCQIWMWLKESNSHFCKIENFGYGEINERSFSNPHPWINAKLLPIRPSVTSYSIMSINMITLFSRICILKCRLLNIGTICVPLIHGLSGTSGWN